MNMGTLAELIGILPFPWPPAGVGVPGVNHFVMANTVAQGESTDAAGAIR